MNRLLHLKRNERSAWGKLYDLVRVVDDTKHEHHYSTKRLLPPAEVTVAEELFQRRFQEWFAAREELNRAESGGKREMKTRA